MLSFLPQIESISPLKLQCPLHFNRRTFNSFNFVEIYMDGWIWMDPYTKAVVQWCLISSLSHLLSAIRALAAAQLVNEIRGCCGPLKVQKNIKKKKKRGKKRAWDSIPWAQNDDSLCSMFFFFHSNWEICREKWTLNLHVLSIRCSAAFNDSPKDSFPVNFLHLNNSCG